MSEYNITEVPPTRSVSASTFASGLLDFPLSVGAPNAWIPNKSYFRIEMTLSSDTAGAVAPTIANGLAFADNVCGNLFNNASFKMGGLDACSLTSYQSQCSALSTRMNHTNGWLSTVGKSAFGTDYSFTSRVLAVSSDNSTNNIGSSLVENITFRTANAANYVGATITITVATTATATTTTATGANTLFQTGTGSPVGPVVVGDTLVVNGTSFTVQTITAETTITLAPTGSAVDAGVATTNWYFIRKNIASSNQGKNKIYVLWQPPLGIFNTKEPLGAGDYRFTLNPDPNFRLTGVETYNPNFANAASYTLQINSMNFYAAVCKMSIPEGPSVLSMVEMLAMSKPYSQSLQFSVPASTFMLTLFAQNTTAGSSPVYPPSRFKTVGTAVGTVPVYGDTSLSNIQITYANINKPPSRWTSAFIPIAAAGATTTNELQQRYVDSYCDAQMIGSDEKGAKTGQIGGIEDFNQWIQRGPFYNFLFMKDSSSRATEVLVNIQYADAAIDSTNTNIFLVAWFRRTVDYVVSAGMITQLASRDV